uniref:Uracil DNA glycosylase superfamily protein n=1 Tax=Candidatus Kentrum sp. SD TaxID=2126332 RepID=A0A451BL21_9GAMM|nr:MAG: Uracil DNA glycosylase superfamily protein [Candidatus Kentron sp. SD]VFK43215.1 MAG: Uracil DNA glycosylase superfamily protein [Candidatus Kentron sp. SD]VFK78987.1 MAG: Uracil DNA glycosylase superfamily protein [Candidatus Kentron sp. SD]
MLKAACEYDIDSIRIGRDLGYRGGRRTGLAFTDDVHLDVHGARWGISVARPTKGGMVAERTAAIVWDILSRVKDPVFLWNVFPLYPHEPDNPFTNRPYNPLEHKAGEEFLAQLISLLRPRRLIAIGNDAALTANRLFGPDKAVKVRHPSYGGQTQFLAQVAGLYELCEPRQCVLSFGDSGV